MNVEKILKVADAIEQHSIPDLGFNMGSYIEKEADPNDDRSGHHCGTLACIAGWAWAVEHGRIPTNEDENNVSFRSAGREILSLDWITADQLFEGAGMVRNATPGQAVRTLRHLADTGEVNWDLP